MRVQNFRLVSFTLCCWWWCCCCCLSTSECESMNSGGAAKAQEHVWGSHTCITAKLLKETDSTKREREGGTTHRTITWLQWIQGIHQYSCYGHVMCSNWNFTWLHTVSMRTADCRALASSLVGCCKARRTQSRLGFWHCVCTRLRHTILPTHIYIHAVFPQCIQSVRALVHNMRGSLCSARNSYFFLQCSILDEFMNACEQSGGVCVCVSAFFFALNIICFLVVCWFLCLTVLEIALNIFSVTHCSELKEMLSSSQMCVCARLFPRTLSHPNNTHASTPIVFLIVSRRHRYFSTPWFCYFITWHRLINIPSFVRLQF